MRAKNKEDNKKKKSQSSHQKTNGLGTNLYRVKNQGPSSLKNLIWDVEKKKKGGGAGEIPWARPTRTGATG